METPHHTIDATNQQLGRIASRTAALLLGKSSPSYVGHRTAPHYVTITNAGKLNVSEKKSVNTRFARYSGYPGGLRYETIQDVIAKKGQGEILRQAVNGMLPKNASRRNIMKNLTITD